MTTVQINGHTVQPESQLPGGHHFARDASGSDYILIQCSSYLEPEQADELRRHHVQILDYLAKNTYLCRYEPKPLDEIRGLPFVQYANVYHNDLVVTSDFKEKTERVASLRAPLGIRDAGEDAQGEEASQPDQGIRYFAVTLHQNNRATAALEQISKMPSVVHSSILNEGHGVIRVRFDLSDLAAVASIDDVATIDEIHPTVPFNHKAHQVLGLLDPRDWGRKNGLGNSGSMGDLYQGGGQAVVVCDTGFDIGSNTDVHPAFKGRVIELRPWARTSPAVTLDDSGHGTHVAASVLGRGTSSQFFGNIDGTAPKAGLYLQAVGTAAGAIDVDTNGGLSLLLLSVLSSFRASKTSVPRYLPRIHTNSWGTPWVRGQTLSQTYAAGGSPRTLDEDLRDNQEWVVLFGAGNDGERFPAPHIQVEAAAKNVITVGACENLQYATRDREDNTSFWNWSRRIVETEYKYDPTRPVGDPSNVADFSSRGPTREGRQKPDVVAPGTVIYSARSRQPNLLIAKQKWYNIPFLVGYDYNQTGESTDNLWWFMNGTSMATPLVAGCCAVLRNVYCKKKNAHPSGAMVKALLVNGAVDLSLEGTDAARHGGPAPNGVQGFGRVDLGNSMLPLLDTNNGGCYDSRTFPADYTAPFNPNPKPLAQGASYDQPLTKGRKGWVLTATMAYADVRGAALVNVLNMGVRATTSANVQKWADESTANPALPKGENNVQKLIWTIPTDEIHKITVKCQQTLQTGHVSNSTQDFALCWHLAKPKK